MTVVKKSLYKNAFVQLAVVSLQQLWRFLNNFGMVTLVKNL